MNEQEKASGAGKRSGKITVLIVAVLALALYLGYSWWSGNQIADIKAEYHGATGAGTVLDSENAGIQVTGRTRNRSEVEIPFHQWTVETAQVLSPDMTSAVNIQYKGKTCELRVACTDSQVASIRVSYAGTKEAGTVISNTAEGFSAIATLRSGEEVDITDSCVMDGGSVTLKENKTAAVKVSYTDPFSGKVFSASLDVVCDTKTVKQIAAKYVGQAPEGEVLDSDNPNFVVTATYDNGSVEQVQGWEIRDPSTVSISKSACVTIHYGGQETQVVVQCSDFNPDTYRKNCGKYKYNNLVRYPEKYIGSMIRASGRIVQVYEGAATTSGYAYQIRVGSRKYINIAFQGTLDKGNLIVGDYVTCYGTFVGIDSDDNRYPLIHARIVER